MSKEVKLALIIGVGFVIGGIIQGIIQPMIMKGNVEKALDTTEE